MTSPETKPVTTFFLEEHADEQERTGKRLIIDIEHLESQLVNMRGHRDEAFRRAAELRTAANILRDIGLRSGMTDRGPFVEMDYTPKRPEIPA